MPNRILREGILTSERVDAVSPEAELFFRRLMSAADDFGRYTAHPSLLRAALYPLRIDRITGDQVKAWLQECEAVGLITTYQAEGKSFIMIANWRQTIRQKTASKFPDPPNDDTQMRSARIVDAPHARPSANANASANAKSIADASTNTSAGTEAIGDLTPKARNLLNTALTTDSSLAFNPDDLLGSIRRTVGEPDWTQNEKMWTARTKKLSEAYKVHMALEDYYQKTPDERADIDNPAAYLTQRFMAHGGKSVKRGAA